MFGNLGEFADIDKENDSFLFLAGQGTRTGDSLQTVFRVQKRGDRQVADRAKLAGKAHIIIDADTFDRLDLVGVWRGRLLSCETMRTRQVVQRPFPPQTDWCGILPILLASRIVVPRDTRTLRPFG